VTRLATMTVDDLVTVASGVREAADGASSMEQAAQATVDRLFGDLVDEGGGPACALVRLYVTARLGDLEPRLQELARAAVPTDLDVEPAADTRCVTLLGSAGVEPAWNDRRASRGHQAIPLLDEGLVERLPMVAGLLRGLGMDSASVVRPDPEQHAARSRRRYDVFFVPEASTSPFIPDQVFVAGHGVRSAVGFGGVLPSGELFAVLVFATVAVPEATAELLQSLALTVQSVVVPHTYRVFEPSVPD